MRNKGSEKMFQSLKEKEGSGMLLEIADSFWRSQVLERDQGRMQRMSWISVAQEKLQDSLCLLLLELPRQDAHMGMLRLKVCGIAVLSLFHVFTVSRPSARGCSRSCGSSAPAQLRGTSSAPSSQGALESESAGEAWGLGAGQSHQLTLAQLSPPGGAFIHPVSRKGGLPTGSKPRLAL